MRSQHLSYQLCREKLHWAMVRFLSNKKNRTAKGLKPNSRTTVMCVALEQGNMLPFTELAMAIL